MVRVEKKRGYAKCVPASKARSMSKKEKGRKWDGKSRVSNDLYRKNFEIIFGKKIDKDKEELEGYYIHDGKIDVLTKKKS